MQHVQRLTAGLWVHNTKRHELSSLPFLGLWGVGVGQTRHCRSLLSFRLKYEVFVPTNTCDRTLNMQHGQQEARTHTEVAAWLQDDPVSGGLHEVEGSEADDALPDHALSSHPLQAVEAKPQPHARHLVCNKHGEGFYTPIATGKTGQVSRYKIGVRGTSSVTGMMRPSTHRPLQVKTGQV